MLKIAELETPRLRLRGWREADVDDMAAINADAEGMRFIGDGRTFTRAETWRIIAGMIGHWALRGYGQWAVESKETGRVIGRVGFIHPEGWPGLEIGWHLAREAWGRGYATEAARAALDHGRDVYGIRRVISLIYPANAPSIRVAEKLGERFEREEELFGAKLLVYGLGEEA